MGKLKTLVAIALLGSVVPATAAVASVADKTVSNGKYAKLACGSFKEIEAALKEIQPANTTDPAAFQTDVLKSSDQFIASIEATRAKLKKVAPNDGGKSATKSFDRYYKTFETEIKKARDAFASADATSPAFTGDVTVFTTALETIDTRLPDPVSKLGSHQDLLHAFKSEKSCKGVITIYGG